MKIETHPLFDSALRDLRAYELLDYIKFCSANSYIPNVHSIKMFRLNVPKKLRNKKSKSDGDAS